MPNPETDGKRAIVEIKQAEPELLLPRADQPDRSGQGHAPLAELASLLDLSGEAGTQALRMLDPFLKGSAKETHNYQAIAVHSSVLMDLLGATAATASDTLSSGNAVQAGMANITSPITSAATIAERELETSLEGHPAARPAPVTADNSAASTPPLRPDPMIAQPAANCGGKSDRAPLPMNVVIQRALEALSLLKMKVSSVISVTRVEEEWRVAAELVERAGVPDTSDVLGVYECRLDRDGNVLAYERTRLRRRCDLNW